jgi:hypothetical protein
MRLFGKEQKSEASGWFSTGAPVPGTEATVLAIERGAGGPSALTAVDTGFRADAFVTWAGTVYARATAAWQTHSPEPLKPVMAAPVWDDYARHLLGAGSLRLMQAVMAAGRATPALMGTGVGGGQQSALVTFDVKTDPAAYAQWGLPDEHRTWSERWLFQRAADCRTHASGAVAACPVCGAPAEPEESGRCRYCHADITTRTAGWLVTRTQTTLATMAKWDAGVERARAHMTEHVAVTAPPSVAPPSVAPPLQPPRAGPPPQPPRAGPPPQPPPA